MKIILILSLFLPGALFAQINIAGVITNRNKEPLPLTNIALLHKNTGTITNDKGMFTISNMLPDDTIKITNIAFASKLISAKDLINMDTIILDENIKKLPEIEIRNFLVYRNDKKLGFFNQPENGEFKLKPGNQIALYIFNRMGKEAWIKGVSFKVKNKGKCNNSIRIRIFQSDTLKGQPTTDLLSENVLITNSELKKSNYVDLTAYKVILPPEGVFVVIEWVYPDTVCDANSYSSIAACLSVPENLVWFNFRDRAWTKNFRPRLPNGNYMTPDVGLKVAYR